MSRKSVSFMMEWKAKVDGEPKRRRLTHARSACAGSWHNRAEEETSNEWICRLRKLRRAGTGGAGSAQADHARGSAGGRDRARGDAQSGGKRGDDEALRSRQKCDRAGT